MFNFFFPLFFSWMVGENVKEGSLCFVLTFVLFLVLLLIVLLDVFVHLKIFSYPFTHISQTT